ncbi:MAG TPA: hypothetical protein VGE07_01145, partial [Herpetosiphonaceae bacterium]
AALLIVIAVTASIILGQPGMSERIGLVEPTATAAPVPTGSTNRQYQKSLQVTVARDATADDIKAAFLAEFADEAKNEFGVETRVGTSIQPTYIGAPQEVRIENDQRVMSVTMLGWISVPNQ